MQRLLRMAPMMLLLLLSGACVEAQLSFQYDLAGHLISQSNMVSAALPAFQAAGQQYVGLESNELLSVSAPVTGVGPFTYQWLFNGTAIPGATNDSLLLSNVVAISLGKYQLVASNSFGAVTSAVVNVSFFDPHGNGLPVAWELQYFGVTGVDPKADPDGDGVSNYDEYLDGTDPTNPNSVMPRLYISVGPGGFARAQPTKPKYRLDESVLITSLLEPGSLFAGWTGSYAPPRSGTFTSSGANLTVVMNSTTWISVNFGGHVVPWGFQTSVPAGLSDVVAVATGGGASSLGLRSNRTVVGWSNGSIQTNVPAGLSNVVAISGGYAHNLALQSNGTIVAWGDNSQGQANVPAGVSNAAAIAGGYYYSLAERSDGTVVAWGDNTYGQTNVPTGLSNVTAIAAGAYHCLALQSNGAIVAWGDDSNGQTDVPPGLSDVAAIAAGAYFSLALRSNGTVVAWGDNGYNELAIPPGLSNVIAIAAGFSHSLALQGDGTVAVWGTYTISTGTKTPPPGLRNVVSIAAGGYQSLALVGDGTPYFFTQPVNTVGDSGGTASLSAVLLGEPPLSYQWQFDGTNIAGATGATLTLTNVQPANAGVYTLVVSNFLGTTASASANLTVSNAAPSIVVQPVSQPVLLGTNAVLSVAATGSSPLQYQWQFNGTNIGGATHSVLNLPNISLTNLGSYRVAVSNAYGGTLSSNAVLSQTVSLLAAWGYNSYGETNVPAVLNNVVAVSAGYQFSLALQSSGTVAAWGNNYYGQLNLPAALSNVVAIDAGYAHSLALQSNGTVVAWGYNGYGATNVPAGLSNVVAIAAGYYHSLALEANGTVVAWGYNGYGETNVPAGLSNVVAVAAGYYHSLALEADGTVVAWGNNTAGETNVPPGLSSVVAIAAGYYHSLALEADGTVVAWGDNYYGQLNVPEELSNVVAIAGGGYHSLALQSNGTVVAWGGNGSVQTNVPAGLSNVVVIAAGGYHSLVVFNDGSPVFTERPVSTLADSGATEVLNTGLVGEPPLTLQWQFNGTNIAGATNVTLTLTDLQTTNSGVYSLVAGNSLGVASSVVTTLTVSNAAPVILVQPASKTVLPGASAAFSVTAAGSLPLTYQWQFNTTNISGATQSGLNLANVVLTNQGNYRVAVSNAYGGVLSSNAALAVLPLAVAWGANTNGQASVPPTLTSVAGVSAGYAFSEVLRSNGTVAAWGNGTFGETNVPTGISNLITLSAGYYHTLGLTSNGTVAAWGYNNFGQTNVPTGLSNVVAVAGGGYHSLALKSSGAVVAWGYNNNGQTNVPAGLSNVVAIAAGQYFSLALQGGGTVTGWGGNANGQLNVPAGLNNVVGIAAGGYHSLALKANGTVVAWGFNGYGQTNVPAGLTNVVAIAAGYYYSLALKANGTVVAWGDNSAGQTNVPAGLTNVIAIAAGAYHALAAINNGSPFFAAQPINAFANSGATDVLSVGLVGQPPLSYQWQFNGTNIAGATGATLTLTNVQAINAGVYVLVASNALGTARSAGANLTVVSNAPPVILTQPSSLAVYSGANASFSVAATGSFPLNYQWQQNGVNLAGATQATLNVPAAGPTSLGSYRVAVSSAYGSVLSSNAVLTLLSFVEAWGANTNGQANVPAGLTNVAAIGAGYDFSEVLRSNGTVTAWGNGALHETNVPAGLTNVAAIAAGYYHSVAIQSNGTVVAWGYNIFGQTNVPAGLSNVVAVAGGGYHSLALQSNGTIVAWGYNNDGQTNVPAGLSNVTAIAAGQFFSLAIQAGGIVTGWGGNANGQLNVPAGLSNVVGIAAGGFHSLALQANGTVVAWGNNGYGQTNVPQGLSNVVAIAAGYYYSLALEANGTVVAWGDNSDGQTSLPVGLSNVVAITAGAFHSLALLHDASPLITIQPANTVADSGGTALLSVGVVGEPPLGYQWQFNGSNLFGATNAILSLTNVQATNAGTYSVVASNSVGSASSVGAILTVVTNAAPAIVAQPSDQRVFSGANAGFTVVATGSAPLNYQWWFNGTNLTGATNAVLLLTGVSPANQGGYFAILTNSYGRATSSIANLFIVPANDAFSNRSALGGYSNTVAAANSFATTEPGEPEHAGNAGGSSVWWSWTAPTNGMVTISTLGSSFDTLVGVYTGAAVANLSLVASNDDAGSRLTGEVTFPAAAGTTYQIAVDGYDGATGSIVLAVQESSFAPPVFTVQPQSQTGTIGASAAFSVVASGVGPLGYQWLSNNVPLAGATNSILALNNLQPGDAANYKAMVTSLHGSTTSSNAVLSVVVGPPNDMFANRINIPGMTNTVAGNNVFATAEPGEPDHGESPGGSSVWWTWTAPAAGSVTVSTLGSTFNTLLAVYTGGAVSNLTLIANDNSYGGYRGYDESVIEFTATGAATYQIAVDGYNGASGSVSLSLQETPFVQMTNGTAPLMLNASVQGNLLLISFNATAGQTYAVQYVNSLNSGAWAVLTNIVATSTNVVCYDTITNSPKRFYRISLAQSVATEAIHLAGTVQGAQLLLSFNSTIGAKYVLQYTADLPGGWTTLTNVMATATNAVGADTIANGSRRFYRVMKPGN